VIVATGPLTSPALAAAIRGMTGEDAARLLRRDRARSCIATRSISATAWFQSRYDKGETGGGRTDYINCPLDRDAIRGVRRRALAGEKTQFKEWERDHALFRGLPAGRGDGRARARDAALRADEAGRAARSARTRREAACRRAAAAGQCAGHALQHGRVPDEAEARRAEAHLPHDPRARGAEFARLGGCTATPSSTARGCSTGSCASRRRRGCASPARSPARGLCRERGDGAARRSVCGGERGSAPTSRRRPRRRRSARCCATSPAMPRRGSFQPMNVNFGLFPPLSPKPGSPAPCRHADRKPLLARRALADLAAWHGAAARAS
jgi:methylenetetrahydrofolate--tRNA-(uracil-5-)-methyltransferase